MKRRDLLRLLMKQGCVMLRDGRRHSVFYNPKLNQTTTVPRHAEINEYLAKKICHDLGIIIF